MTLASHGQNYKLCDCNHDGQVTIADAMMVVDVVINGYAPFSVSPGEVTMSVGGTATLDIIGGYSLYEAVSANSEVVNASLNGATVTLSAVAAGETTVTVKDVQTFRAIEVPVKVNYNSLMISSSELSLVVGDQGMVSITSGNGSYTVRSSDAGVATATLSGISVKVAAISVGTATITVTDRLSGKTSTIKVTVKVPYPELSCPDNHRPHLIDLGLPSGTKWACCNVGADKPENLGGYYAWGETETKSIYSWSTYTHCDGSKDTCHDLGSEIASTEYDVAHVKWGGSWVTPSEEQQSELRQNCTYEWTTLNGVKGGKFTSNINGVSIFLPITGYRDGSTVYDTNSYGLYWSSTQFLPYMYGAYHLFFYSSFAGRQSSNRYTGRNVRPVSRK